MLPSVQSYTYILSFIAKTASTSLLPLMSSLVRQCHTWREALPQSGTVALEPCHYHDLSDHWGLGGIYTIPLPPQRLSLLPQPFISCRNRKLLLSLSPPLVTLSSQASPLISSSILERKRCQTRLESKSTDSQT